MMPLKPEDGPIPFIVPVSRMVPFSVEISLASTKACEKLVFRPSMLILPLPVVFIAPETLTALDVLEVLPMMEILPPPALRVSLLR